MVQRSQPLVSLVSIKVIKGRVYTKLAIIKAYTSPLQHA